MNTIKRISNILLFNIISRNDIKVDNDESNNISHLHCDIVLKAQHIFEYSRSETPVFPYGGVKQDYKSMDKIVK